MVTFDELAMAPGLKIQRAKHHIADLNRRVNAYVAKGDLCLTALRDPERREATLFFETYPTLPPLFGLIIGDAVHNLRSALDLLVWQMVAERTKAPGKVQFPMATKAVTDDVYKQTIHSRQIHLAGEDVVDALTAIRPYPGGDDLLAGLNTLNIADKHRLILTVSETLRLDGRWINEVTREFWPDGWEDARIKLGHTPKQDLSPGEFYQKPKAQPPLSISFGEGEAFAGEHVSDTLRAIAARVGEVCDTLIYAYLRGL